MREIKKEFSNLIEAMVDDGIPVPNKAIGYDRFTRWGKNNRYSAKYIGDGGVYRDWREGDSRFWFPTSSKPLTSAEKKQRSKQIEDAKRELQEEIAKHHNEAAKKASKEWEQYPNTGHSTYLERKKVGAFGIRYGKGFIVIPLRDIDGNIQSLQKIYDDGHIPAKLKQEGRNKDFLFGGKKKGCFHTIGIIENGNQIDVAEGYSTGASGHMATGFSTVIAFDAGNLDSVIGWLRKKYPDSPIRILGDDDRWPKEDGTINNTGRISAEASAKKYGCSVIFPKFKDVTTRPTDFNDLHVSGGIDAVKSQLSSAEALPLPLTRKELAALIAQTDDIDELIGLIADQVTYSGLTEPAMASLRKMIAQKAKIPVASLTKQARVFADKDRNHLQVANAVIDAYGRENILFTQSCLWRWYPSNGVWKKIDDREIKQKIHDITEGDELTKTVTESIVDMVKTEVHDPDHEFNVAPDSINCLNGELSLNDDKWQLDRHNREHYHTAQLPIAYDKNASAPRFMEFLKQIFDDDMDKDAKILLTMELMGYSLQSSCKLEKFIILIGEGANGKTVLLNVLNAMVGQDNCTAVQPNQFDSRFQLAYMQGKLVNLVTEISADSTLADAQLKALVTGEMITAEHKHKPPFSFKPTAKMWFGTNHMPHTKDFSYGLLRRAIILTFNRRFEGKNKDVNLTQKLLVELSGILNLVLAAYAGVLLRGEFTDCPSSENAKLQWRKDEDHVTIFIEDCCVLEGSTTSQAIYTSYGDWTQHNGIRNKLSQQEFTKRLCRSGIISTSRTAKTRYLEGISLQP